MIIDNFISQKNVQRIAKKHKVRQFELRQLKEKLKKNLRLKSFFRLTRLANGYFGWHNLVKLLMPCRFRLREIEKRFWYKIFYLCGLYKLNWNVLKQDMRVLSVKVMVPTKEQRPFESDNFFHFVKPYPNPPTLIIFKKRCREICSLVGRLIYRWMMQRR